MRWPPASDDDLMMAAECRLNADFFFLSKLQNADEAVGVGVSSAFFLGWAPLLIRPNLSPRPDQEKRPK